MNVRDCLHTDNLNSTASRPQILFAVEYLEVEPDGCPRLRVPGGLLSANGEIALGYHELGYRPIPLIQDSNGSWIPGVKWAPFQERTPTREEVVDWWRRNPNAGIALVCGRDTGLVVLDIDPRHGGLDPGLSAPACSSPRGGVHYHFTAPEPIPDHYGPGVDWLGDGHIARVPPTPGYIWRNGGLPRISATYQAEELPSALLPRKPHPPTSVSSTQGDLCDELSHALGKNIRPGTTIACFCHHDEAPSLAIYPDHAHCFSQKRRFSPYQVLQGLGFAHLLHIEAGKNLYEPNVQDASVRSNAPNQVRLAEEKQRLVSGLKGLGVNDKMREVEMCGQWMTREKNMEVKTRTCEDCKATFVIQSRCRYRFCPECAAIDARDELLGKEELFEKARCAIVRLPLPSLPENSNSAFARAKKEVLAKLRSLLGRGCGPACHKILTGCRRGEFRWELVVLAAEADIDSLVNDWPYGTARVLKGFTPAQAMALYLEVVSRPPEWETPGDLAILNTMLYRQRMKGNHGSAHGNSRAMKAKPKAPRVAQRCPVCGSTNLSRTLYRDPDGVRLVNGIPLWFPPSDRSPPHNYSRPV